MSTPRVCAGKLAGRYVANKTNFGMLIDVERSVRCSCRRPPPGDDTESYDIFFSNDGGCTLGIVFERESRDKWGSSNVPVVEVSRVDAT